MHCAASRATCLPRVVPGAWVSRRSIAPRSLSRHFRFCPAEAATIAETASNPASCTTTISASPVCDRKAALGDKSGRSAPLPEVVKLADCTREWGMKFYNYHPRLNTDHPEIIQAA